MNRIIRLMTSEDMPAVWAIQCECYQHILEPESVESLDAKRQASADSCFVAIHQGKVCGYLISMPWTFAQVPALNDPSCNLPADLNVLYLHDMAIAPCMAGQGVGQALFSAYQQAAKQLGFSRLALTAVGDAQRYWIKLGFKEVDLVLNQQKVADYGGQVSYMYQDC